MLSPARVSVCGVGEALRGLLQRRLAMSSLALLVLLASLWASVAEAKCPAEYGYMCMAGNMGKRGGDRYPSLNKLFHPGSETQPRAHEASQSKSSSLKNPSWNDYRELVWRLTGLNRRDRMKDNRIPDYLYQDY